MSELPPTRHDPIGERHFKPLEIADRVSDIFFYVAAVLSFAALLVEKTEHPILYDLVQIAFVLVVLTVFFSGIAIKLYWRPSAEDRRRAELISNASQVALTAEKTEGYYNNAEIDPIRRLGVIVMENSHFSKAIALKMLFWERTRIAAYVVLFLIAVLYRKTDLAIASTAAQAVFSEQLLSRWLRLEWFRIRCESVFNQAYALFQSSPSKKILLAKVIELFGLYETGKANAGISLSSKIFFANNETLSREWEQIKAALKL
ncbi:hypothetical protein [Bradyrhizobium sp. CCGUVB14]|uniref:hypothetical protein n=1 Tax=Bradyrhizobium sp. CCGUVB14 TaxID=2949628 RepID=UPI0020B43FC7|nr:hypothetical protein [Bradyrhizobium sp. CCGUVB14]MCP3439789.1 hypothetical protein [Bradyrhizobium sp. CCGUVB14]